MIAKLNYMKDPKVVSGVIEYNGGVFDEDKNWIPLKSGKILGIVELGQDNGCSIILNTKHQTIKELHLCGDMSIRMSKWPSGGIFHGELNQENVDLYNKRQVFESAKIVSFVTM